MKYPLLDILRKFVANEIDPIEFRDTVEQWNQTGLWDGLSKKEYKLLSDFFYKYFDMYAGESLPQFNWWERFKRDMRGEGNIDLKGLRKGSADLLTALEKEQHKK